MTPDRQAEIDELLERMAAGRPDRFGHRVLAMEFGSESYSREELNYMEGQCGARGLRFLLRELGGGRVSVS